MYRTSRKWTASELKISPSPTAVAISIASQTGASSRASPGGRDAVGEHRRRDDDEGDAQVDQRRDGRLSGRIRRGK